MSTTWLKAAVKAARWLFAPAAVAFLLAAAWRSRDLFATLLEQAAWAPLLAAVVLWALLHLLSPVFTCLVLRDTGTELPYLAALQIHVSRLPARYLPGGIWHTVSRVVDLHRLGVGKAQLTSMVVLENTVPVAAALLLGGVFLLSGERPTLGWAAALSGAGVLALPPLLMRHRIWKDWPRVRPRTFVATTSVSLAFWLIAGAAFVCYWSAFPEVRSDAPFIEVYGSYLLAWSAGFLSVFAPQGIGVFEAVIGTLLKGALPFAGAAVLAAGFRSASLAADMLAWSALHIVRSATHMPVRD